MSLSNEAFAADGSVLGFDALVGFILAVSVAVAAQRAVLAVAARFDVHTQTPKKPPTKQQSSKICNLQPNKTLNLKKKQSNKTLNLKKNAENVSLEDLYCGDCGSTTPNMSWASSSCDCSPTGSPALSKYSQDGSQDGPGEKRMGTAYKIARSLVRDRLEEQCGSEDLEVLDSMSMEDVIVVEGCYDHIHLAMQHTGIPFTQVTQRQLAGLSLTADQTVYVNCSSNFPPECAHKLAKFVESGGQLITTDWGLLNVLEVGFPGYVKHNGKMTSDEVVKVEVCDKEDAIVQALIDEKTAPCWWLEGSSYPIQVVDKKKVTVLVRSRELGKLYGDDAVIVHFKHGEGEVYHILSHIYLQRSEARDTMGREKASTYAKGKGGKASTISMWEAEESACGDLDYSSVQSAVNNSEMFTRVTLKQKKTAMARKAAAKR